MTFSVEDHGIVRAPPPSAQVFICPQEILINFDHLAAIRSALLLASSRSETGRDDRGAYYLQILRGLSAYQIQVHYLAYAVVQRVFRGTSKSLAAASECSSLRVYIPMLGFWKFMALSDKEEPTTIIGHVLLGLHRESLIGGAYAAGDLETIRAFAPKAEQPGIVLEPTGLGANFFLWAMGRGDVPLQRFFAEDAVCGIDTQLPELPLAVPAG